MLRVPVFPPTPGLTGRSSANASSGLWQEAQLTVRSDDSTGSKNRRRPSSTRIWVREGADVDGEDVDGADVDGADIDGAEVDGEDVDGADIDGADVDGADVDGADVDDADVDGAEVDGAEVDAGVDGGAEPSGSAAISMAGIAAPASQPRHARRIARLAAPLRFMTQAHRLALNFSRKSSHTPLSSKQVCASILPVTLFSGATNLAFCRNSAWDAKYLYSEPKVASFFGFDPIA